MYEIRQKTVKRFFLREEPKGEQNSLSNTLMKKKKRYLNRDEVGTLLKGQFKTIYNKSGTLKYILGEDKLTVIISSKQEKRAVYRNKIKRRVRALFFKEKRGIWAIFYPAKSVFSLEYKEFEALFNDLIKKIQ